ncbi:hypothetical protein NQ314_002465 [Rhamnusium bicolor]|uniref:Centrosomal protein of 290 kDa n=1 Tax=Rhamnusium bicolor TaxID=1586634 RepID=A0AAV8ZRB0_9CUCU|nr:hypothetical protein NQ314_002465 [Rhamnusium bicolor]
MDWKYILSLTPEDLNDEEKDELYTTVTWFDCDNEEINVEKCKALLKVSQEILKYKGEQVETLLHELEEVAIRQGEEEARRLESDTDARSSRSRNSIEYENLEQKYMELRAKHKKVSKNNEKYVAEIDKLNNKIRHLEHENRRLQNEIQSGPQGAGSSESDVSETIRDQQKELVETIHSKNKQISDLLQDIEEVEKDNFVLRNKLSNVRDELATATKEMVTMTEILKAKDTALEENQESFQKVSDQYEKILDQKDAEIKELKSSVHQTSVHSSLSSLPNDEMERSQINALQRILSERENQLIEVQTQLQIATREMEESTEIMKKLKFEREQDANKIKEFNESVKDLKKQVKGAHQRCQNLQEEVAYAEKCAASKEEELKIILGKLRENGQIDLVVKIEELQELKSDNRIKEKQIINLVRTSNKLQDNCDLLEKENMFLRSKPVYDNCSVEVAIDLRLKEENKALVDENEALRKGMHEILNSINVKKGSTLNEIKSETFEQLLRALDVKHISGWYHPAMRLQAELHNLEGINAELREQLRETKIEVQTYRSIEDKTESDHLIKTIPEPAEAEEKVISDQADFAEDDNLEHQSITIERLPVKDLTSQDHIQEVMVEQFKKILEKSRLILDKDDIIIHFEKELHVIRQQIIMLFNEVLNDKTKLEELVKSMEGSLKNLGDEYEMSEAKLKVLAEDEAGQDKFKKIEEVVSENVLMNRKVRFLQMETTRLNLKIENLNNDIRTYQTTYTKNIAELSRANKTMENNLRILKNLNEISVDFEVFKETQKNLDDMTIKYRELTSNVKKQNEAKDTEFKMMEESQKNLEKDKAELKNKLFEVLSKVALQSIENVDEKVQKLSQKLAECEVSEITERQRANHTNNLYELVKEQLNKSEERFQEYTKYNEDLLKKNLILQEQLKEAEDNLCNYIDRGLYKQLQTTNNDLLKQNETLETLRSKLEEDLKLAKESFNTQQMWNNCKEQELLNLRHQIVDLVSSSDEKIIIAQLNSDLLYCRQSENIYKAHLEEAVEELKITKDKSESSNAKYEQEKMEAMERESQMTKRIGTLQNLLTKQKQQYLGCAPLYCEEIYLDNLRTINKEKHETFLNLYKARMLENETEILREQLEIELQNLVTQKQIIAEGDKEEFKKVLNWMNEKKTLQLNELRYKRQSEFKEIQLQHFMERVKMQDEQISKLNEELLLWQKDFDADLSSKESTTIQGTKEVVKPPPPVLKIMKSAEVQTIEVVLKRTENKLEEANQISNLKSEVLKIREETEEKERNINQLKNKITELEMTISLFRKQIGDKQSQIMFYERHILELQNKKDEIHTGGAGGDNIGVGLEANKSNEEVIALKASLKSLQDNLKSREEEIIKYQTLLKVDRDKHSLAAARLQEELQILQKVLAEEKQKGLRMEETFAKSRPNRAAIEQYMTQVHALEKHTAELHTKITSLEAQLQSSRQEAVRWRSLANDRLDAMEELRDSLEEQHKNELSIYKTDSEKLKELGNDEKNKLKQLITKHRSECTNHLDADIEKLVKEKDEKIHELTIKLRQTKNEAKRVHVAENLDSDSSPKVNDLEASNELLLKENDLLKKRYEQLLNKERSAKEEIRDLKAQLLRKPNATRTDRTEKSIKDQLQRKIATLENEIVDLKQNLSEQMSINDAHRVQASEDFDKWKKMKHWQQSSEKLKNKLKERDGEYEKLQQTCAGYRLLIERLEREKHNLENRIKSLKSSNVNVVNSREMDVLKIENMKLMADIEAMNSRLEMQQHHSGGLGAAMMQEKLEGQERKIAILELTAKVSGLAIKLCSKLFENLC